MNRCNNPTGCGENRRTHHAAIVRGNDFILEANASVYDASKGIYVPFDLSAANDVTLSVVGRYSKAEGKDVTVEGNKVSAKFFGSLSEGPYGVEILFLDPTGRGRIFERGLFEIVGDSSEAFSEAVSEGGDGEGYNISVDVKSRTVRIGKTAMATDYALIENKPSINDVELSGNKTSEDLGLAAAGDIPTKVSQLKNDSKFISEHQKIKTVNGESLIGEGNIEIKGGSAAVVDSEFSDSSKNPVENRAITKALTELQDYCFPLSLEATVSPLSAEWTGSPVEITVGFKVLRNSKAVTADLISINFNGESKSSENVASGSEKFIITSQGYKSGSVSAKKGTAAIKNSPRGISVNLYLPVYYGFSKAEGKDDIVITELTKGGSSIGGTKTLNNDDATKYLWLCVPSSMSINKVTSSGFDVPFLAPVESNTTLGSYKCYRSQDLPGSGDMTIVIS